MGRGNDSALCDRTCLKKDVTRFQHLASKFIHIWTMRRCCENPELDAQHNIHSAMHDSCPRRVHESPVLAVRNGVIATYERSFASVIHVATGRMQMRQLSNRQLIGSRLLRLIIRSDNQSLFLASGDPRTEKRVEQPESKRPTLVEYARIFGIEIPLGDESLERSVDEIVGFLADIDSLDLDGVPPASLYDPAWPRVNEARL